MYYCFPVKVINTTVVCVCRGNMLKAWTHGDCDFIYAYTNIVPGKYHILIKGKSTKHTTLTDKPTSVRLKINNI
jgi:hypothetical protein